MEQRLCTERVTSGDARRLFASTSLEKQWLHLVLNSPHLFLPGRTTAKIGPTHSSTERETLVPGSTFALETLHSVGYILSIFFPLAGWGDKIRQFTACDWLKNCLFF